MHNSLIKTVVLLSFVGLLSGCVSRSRHDAVVAECDALKTALENEKKTNSLLSGKIAQLNDRITKLSYPADQRYNHILNLVKADSLDLALIEIENLKSIFPNSKEAEQSDAQITIIEKRKAQIKAEQERIKALGFKVFKDKSAIWCGDTRYTFSNFRFRNRFTFDNIQDVDEYSYRVADKDKTYILADLSIYTKSSYASKPSVYACKIEDGKLSQIAWFDIEYESYDTYGAYVGNYSETSHDFSKVNTVNYNIAGEITLEEARKPIIVLMGKDGKYSSVHGLTVEEVRENCEVICILNRGLLK